MIKISPIPAFDDNYIWCLYDTNSLEALVVDPGDAAPVDIFLTEQGLSLSAILITHHHFDHTGGLEQLSRHNPTIFGPQNDQIKNIDNRLVDGEQIEILGVHFEIIEIPGHTLDHIAYYSADAGGSPIVFCGDTLFAGGCGRIFEGDPAMMKTSLDKLAVLPDSAHVYCAHEYTLANLAFAIAVEPGNQHLQQRLIDDQQKRESLIPTVPSSIGLEKATNPFLRYKEAEVIESAAGHADKQLNGDTDVFACIREWKNNF